MRFSVIVPTYNRLPALRRCLHALLTQDYPREDYEIIVVDDGSSDGTSAYLKYMAKTHKNLMQVMTPHRGAGSARNKGIRKARGEFIAFVDDDCIAEQSWLGKLESCFRRSGAPCIGGSVINGVNRPLAWASHFLHFASWLPYGKERYVADCPTANIAFLRSAIGGRLFTEEYACASIEDSKFNHSFCAGEKSILFCPHIVVSHIKWNEQLPKDFFSFLRKEEEYGKVFSREGYKFHGRIGLVLMRLPFLMMLCPRIPLIFLRGLRAGYGYELLVSSPLIILGEFWRSVAIVKSRMAYP